MYCSWFHNCSFKCWAGRIVSIPIRLKRTLHMLWHTCRPGAETCPDRDADELKMDPLSRGGSDAKFSLRYGLVLFSPEWVQWSVCVALYHDTGGRQQGWVQPSKQVEYRWGGTNTVWGPGMGEKKKSSCCCYWLHSAAPFALSKIWSRCIRVALYVLARLAYIR